MSQEDQKCEGSIHSAKHVKFNFARDDSVEEIIKAAEEDDSDESTNMEDEIDDALDEGYMGMQCTLERGYSLSEWDQDLHKRSEQYFDNTLHYQHKAPFRYVPAKKTLLPVRKVTKNKLLMNIDSSGFFNYISCNWMTPLALKAYKSDIGTEELPLPSPYDMCEYNLERLQHYWNKEVAKKGAEDANILRPIWRFIRKRFFICLLLTLTKMTCSFLSSALIIRGIIQWLPSDAPIYRGIQLCLALLFLECVRVVSGAAEWVTCVRTSVKLRAACFGMVYQKLLRLPKLDDKTAGEMLSLFSSDAIRIYLFTVFLHTILTGPFIIILTVFYTLWLMGPWALFGILSYALFYPLQVMVSRLNSQYRVKTLENTDKRLHMITEIITSIKLIKMYAWEDKFADDVKVVRRKEETFLQRSSYVDNISMSLATAFPVIAGITTFLIHIAAGNNLTAAQAIPIMALLTSTVRTSLNFMQYCARYTVEGVTAFKRIQGFLLMDEVEPYVTSTSSSDLAVELLDVSFAHNKANNISHKNDKSPKKVEKNNETDASTELLHFQSLTHKMPPQGMEVIKGLSLSIKKVMCKEKCKAC